MSAIWTKDLVIIGKDIQFVLNTAGHLKFVYHKMSRGSGKCGRRLPLSYKYVIMFGQQSNNAEENGEFKMMFSSSRDLPYHPHINTQNQLPILQFPICLYRLVKQTLTLVLITLKTYI